MSKKKKSGGKTSKNTRMTRQQKSGNAGKSTSKRTWKSAGRSKSTSNQGSSRQYTQEEKQILAVLKQSKSEPVASRALMRKSKVKNKNVFYDTLHNLERNGDIVVDSKHFVSYVPPDKDVKAELVSLSTGFGFARPLEGGDDVFVHGSELKGAFVGDELILTDVKEDERGKRGRVKRITQGTKTQMTGTVHFGNDGQPYLTPDIAVRYDLKIRQGDLGGASDGDKVLAVPKLDGRNDWRFAKVKTVFGTGDSAKVCADAIIEGAGIPHIFPTNVVVEAEDISKTPITQEDVDARLDLRDKPIFTIDGADAKDLDDAILVEKTENGYELGVHIADVSHYIRENTVVDEEAMNRGTSVYFADRVIPMLPESISNGICSLNAGTEKLAFSAIIKFDNYGDMIGYDFKKSIISSKVRGVYSEVNDIFAGIESAEIKAKYEPVIDGLLAAKELANLLKKNAKSRGEMELESGELRFVLDEKGVCVDIVPRSTGEAEELIEHMMISANIAASKYAQENELPFIYRIHESPQEDRVIELTEMLGMLGVKAEEIRKPKPKTSDFAAVLNRVKGTKTEELVSMKILRTMEKAKYSDEEKGHFGLALHDYSHFTSPIRRYPDTSIHRILTAHLSGMNHDEIVKRYGEFAKESAGQSSRCEVRAVNAERNAEDCYVAEYMKAHIGEHYTGIISGMTARGIFVRIHNGAEGFVNFDGFNETDYSYDNMITARSASTGKKLTIGDEIAIIVASSEVSTGRVDFTPDQN